MTTVLAVQRQQAERLNRMEQLARYAMHHLRRFTEGRPVNAHGRKEARRIARRIEETLEEA